jgi:hypothetical protein
MGFASDSRPTSTPADNLGELSSEERAGYISGWNYFQFGRASSGGPCGSFDPAPGLPALWSGVLGRIIDPVAESTRQAIGARILLHRKMLGLRPQPERELSDLAKYG